MGSSGIEACSISHGQLSPFCPIRILMQSFWGVPQGCNGCHRQPHRVSCYLHQSTRHLCKPFGEILREENSIACRVIFHCYLALKTREFLTLGKSKPTLLKLASHSQEEDGLDSCFLIHLRCLVFHIVRYFFNNCSMVSLCTMLRSHQKD